MREGNDVRLHEMKMARRAEAQKEAEEFFRNVNMETEQRQQERLLLEPQYGAGVNVLTSLLEELKEYREQYPERNQAEQLQVRLDQWNLEQWSKRLAEEPEKFQR